MSLFPKRKVSGPQGVGARGSPPKAGSAQPGGGRSRAGSGPSGAPPAPTGAGKTHTMLGMDEEPGIYLRTLTDLFRAIEEASDRTDYSVSMSYLEVSCLPPWGPRRAHGSSERPRFSEDAEPRRVVSPRQFSAEASRLALVCLIPDLQRSDPGPPEPVLRLSGTEGRFQGQHPDRGHHGGVHLQRPGGEGPGGHAREEPLSSSQSRAGHTAQSRFPAQGAADAAPTAARSRRQSRAHSEPSSAPCSRSRGQRRPGRSRP